MRCIVCSSAFYFARVINRKSAFQTSLSRKRWFTRYHKRAKRFEITINMAKFLKSIFHPTDRRKSPHYENEGEEERSESPQMGNKRQLSISRSGRMKQANKKRHSLTLELYGETIQIDPVETPKSMEYHVHSPMSHTAPADLCVSDTTRFEDPPNLEDPVEKSMEVTTLDSSLEIKPRSLAAKSPEEEIDNAFEIIDKS